ncbi:ribonuclease HII [Vaginisenegalia massiliensis]|uniref:ribonuclease HII n=1 Tax=Vaginisenegalia massiliensis TaxID=2058294 RepID=UPI000F544F7F|nr:ribonuclease HII [Vaginisenegalia massiliensis]
MKERKSTADWAQTLAQATSLDDPIWQMALNDPRKSVQTLVGRYQRQCLAQEEARQQHEQRLTIERDLFQNKGAQYIAGVDEVGRGPLAGPVVTAAVILPRDCSELVGVNDSKSITAKKRAEFDRLIRQYALAFHISVVQNPLIDEVNIYQATRLGMLDSVQKLSIQPDYILLDAMTIDSPLPQMSLIKGDQRSLSIAAASILAKEYRDQIMKEYGRIFPEYGFEQHMGYGTKQHLLALKTYGKTMIHRQSFAPVAQTQKLNPQVLDHFLK